MCMKTWVSINFYYNYYYYIWIASEFHICFFLQSISLSCQKHNSQSFFSCCWGETDGGLILEHSRQRIPAPGGSIPWRKFALQPRASNLWHKRRYDDRHIVMMQVLAKRENGNLLNLLYRAVLLTQKGNRSTSLPSWEIPIFFLLVIFG